ncbi:MAG: tetratricopeptide repeat protein [Armatimonadota bacterium]
MEPISDENLVQETVAAPATVLADAERLTSEGRFPEAIACLRSLISRRPDDVPALQELAALCLRTGCVDEAIGHAEAVLAVRPRSVAARELLVPALLQRGDALRARAELETLVALAPASADHRYRLARLFEQEGELGRASRSLHHALECAPSEELAGEIRMSMGLLDTLQLRQILERVEEERVFNVALRQDARAAVEARGYHLSAFGRVILDEAARLLDRVPSHAGAFAH